LFRLGSVLRDQPLTENDKKGINPVFELILKRFRRGKGEKAVMFEIHDPFDGANWPGEVVVKGRRRKMTGRERVVGLGRSSSRKGER
jgi:hypothetical protein